LTGTYLGDRRDEDFGKVIVDEKDWAIHCHILGRSGMGKSWLMRQMLATDIRNNGRHKGAGLCLIDPAGDLYDFAFECVSADKSARERLHLIDFSQDDFLPCLSYFDQASGMDTDAQCRQIVYALQKVFKQAEEAERVQMNKLFAYILPLCKHAGLTFEEIPLLLSSVDPRFRNAVINKLLHEDLINPAIPIQWSDWNNLNRERKSEFIRIMDSIISRVTPFISLSKDSNTSYLFNQDKSTIDFKQAMEERHIILCKMPRSAGMDEKLTDFFGTIIVDKIMNAGYSRDLKKELPPFRVYIDEFSRFVSNQDIERGLNEMRKFRVSFVLAHQNLDQLKRVDDSLYKAVKSNCNVRILFSSDDEDAEVAAKSMFTEYLARDMIQDEMETQMVTPVEETRTITSRSVMDSYTESVMNSVGGGSSTSSGSASQSGASSGTALSYAGDGLGNFLMAPDPIGSTATDMNTSSTSYSSMSAETNTWAQAEGQSTGRATGISETEVPFYNLVVGKQVTSRQFYNQSDKLAQLVHMIVSQTARHAFIQVGRSEPIPFITALVPKPKGVTPRGKRIALKHAYAGDSVKKGNNSGLTKKAIEEQWARRDELKRGIIEEYGHKGLSVSGGVVDAEYEVIGTKPKKKQAIAPKLSYKNAPKKKSDE
jgi:hypothetical protein